jgi:hypothetical protein
VRKVLSLAKMPQVIQMLFGLMGASLAFYIQIESSSLLHMGSMDPKTGQTLGM